MLVPEPVVARVGGEQPVALWRLRREAPGLDLFHAVIIIDDVDDFPAVEFFVGRLFGFDIWSFQNLLGFGLG